MTSTSGFFQAGFSAALLRSAALAIAFIVSASPAHSEAVTLVCQAEAGESFTLRVDYVQKVVALLNSDGTARFSSTARITEGAVEWQVLVKNANGQHFFGSLNRLSGQGKVGFPIDDVRAGHFYNRMMSGPCRRATQKF